MLEKSNVTVEREEPKWRKLKRIQKKTNLSFGYFLIEKCKVCKKNMSKTPVEIPWKI
jgi:hypothetical protein